MMYPALPKSPADLVPLPLCDGPKLKPFDFQGPQKITFLDDIGKGEHSHVFKVKVLGQVYALKLFKFIDESHWNSPTNWGYALKETFDILSSYSEPFNAECRAFGRLEEAGYTNLAVKCFGYLLLDEEHERTMWEQFSHPKLDFNADNLDYEDGDGADNRRRYVGEDGSLPPIRGILKELGTASKELTAQHVPKILRDTIHLQRLGVFELDLKAQQYVSGKIADFSTAKTTPHYLSNPELCPSFTPEAKRAVEREFFKLCLFDYWDLVRILRHHNWADDPEKSIPLCPYPRHKYNLRKTPARERIYTLVDPRLYKYKAPNRKAENGTSAAMQRRRRSGKRGVGKKGSRAKTTAKETKDLTKARKTRLPKTQRWYYDFYPEEAEEVRDNHDRIYDLAWDGSNGELTPWWNRGARKEVEKWDFEEGALESEFKNRIVED